MNPKNNLMIPGCFFIGLGVGLAFDQMTAGIFLGLGAGFILYSLVSLLDKKK